MDAKGRLFRFYTKYNPEKIPQIEETLIKYKGKEDILFQALVNKYGKEPTSEDETISSSSGTITPATTTTTTRVKSTPVSLSMEDSLRERLRAFYERYNPEKIIEVETMLKKYKGKEAMLFDALVKKYGPEPDDEEDDEDDEEDVYTKSRIGNNKYDDQDEKDNEEDDEEEDDEDDDEGMEEDETDKQRKKKNKGGSLFTQNEVIYCPVDGFPPEFCEYGPKFEECKPWLLQNTPDLFLQKFNMTVKELMHKEQQILEGVEGIEITETGGKSKKKSGKKETEKSKDPKVYIERFQRNKKKSVTIIAGIEDFENLKIKDVAKKLGKKFACSASVNKLETGIQQIQLQGDCVDELPDLLVEMFQIPENKIYFVENGKTERAF